MLNGSAFREILASVFQSTHDPNEILRTMGPNSHVTLRVPPQYDVAVERNEPGESGAFVTSAFSRSSHQPGPMFERDDAANCMAIKVTEEGGWYSYEIALDPDRPDHDMDVELDSDGFDPCYIDVELRLPVGVSLKVEALRTHNASISLTGVRQVCVTCTTAMGVEVVGAPQGELHLYDAFQMEVAAFVGLKELSYLPPVRKGTLGRQAWAGSVTGDVTNAWVFQPDKLFIEESFRARRGQFGPDGPSLSA